MRTIEVNVYNYTELSDNAKQRVKEWIFQHGYFWTDEAWGSLQGLEKLFPGLRIRSANFSTWADVDYSTGQMDENLLNLSGARLRTWLINNIYEYLYQRKPQGKYQKNEKTGKWDYKRRSRVIYTETDCPFTGYCMDCDILEPIREFIKSPSENVNMDDLIWRCVYCWKMSAETDCEYQETDEYMAEHCESNNYQFFEDGKIYR